MEQIGLAVDSLETKFVLGGTHRVADGAFSLQIGEQSVKFPMTRREQQAGALQPLLAVSSPAAHGQGAQTVVDPAVRRASTVAPEQFALPASFDLAATGILDKIRTTLVPDASEVTAELYKINVYQTGGHFAPHRDTPRGPTCFGSLLVSLPCAHAGGHLRVSHSGATHVFDFSAGGSSPRHAYYGYGPDAERKKADALLDHRPPASLQWAAFFGDAEHEVKPVTEGARLTLAYILRRDAPPDPTCDILLSRSRAIADALRGALRDPSFLPRGGRIGFECRHLYEEPQLAQAEAALGGASAGAKGKGATVRRFVGGSRSDVWARARVAPLASLSLSL